MTQTDQMKDIDVYSFIFDQIVELDLNVVIDEEIVQKLKLLV